MVYAVTHVLSTIICVDLYRNYITKHKKYFPLFTVLIAGIGGLLPDIDVPLGWILSLLNWNIGILAHRALTHTPLFGLLFLIPGLFFWWRKQHKIGMIFFVISFGIFLHIFLDVMTSDGTSGSMLFWPFSAVEYGLTVVTKKNASTIYASLDAIFLLGWLTREELKHKIKDFF